MSLMINLEALQNNDSLFSMQVTENVAPINTPFYGSATPLNITGYTLKLYVKASNTALDSTATVYTSGNGLTVINAALGELNFVLPHTAATIAGTFWWRLDLTDTFGNIGTAFYGNLYILAV